MMNCFFIPPPQMLSLPDLHGPPSGARLLRPHPLLRLRPWGRRCPSVGRFGEGRSGAGLWRRPAGQAEMEVAVDRLRSLLRGGHGRVVAIRANN